MNTLKAAAILLAGGVGSRMQSSTPKQYLLLKNKPLILYAFESLQMTPEISEIVVVCEEEYQELFPTTGVTFASPGKRRQDSVANGFQAITTTPNTICIHDGARPFITQKMTHSVIEAAFKHGAATTAVPIKFTIKECEENGFVKRTPNRDSIWEIQTPQALKPDLLSKGITYANKHALTVTDDVSFAELQKAPVKLVEGSYDNIKVTTPEDLIHAEAILNHPLYQEQ